MGSVSSPIECPHCKSEAHNEFYYKSGEEYTFCPECGYSHDLTIVRDEEGKWVMDEDGTTPQVKITENKNPYGAYHIKMGQGFGQMGGFADEGEFREFCKQMDDAIGKDQGEPEDGNTIEYITYNRLVKGHIHRDTLYDRAGEYNRLREEWPDPMGLEDEHPANSPDHYLEMEQAHDAENAEFERQQQEDIRLQIEKDAALQHAQHVLDNPENYGLI